MTGATLTRFFGFHVAVLPGFIVLFLAIHLALIQRQGISVPSGLEPAMHVLNYLRKHDPTAAEFLLQQAGVEPQTREMPFFPNFFLRELMAWYIALGALGALAALAPWELGAKADAFAPAPAGIRPEWYFMWMFQTLKLIPGKLGPLDGELVGIALFGVAALLWVLLPFFDRGEGRSQRMVKGAGIFALAYIIVLTAYGYLAK